MTHQSPVPAPVFKQVSFFRRTFALLAPRTLAEPLVQANYALELARKPELQHAPHPDQQQALGRTRQHTIDSLLRLRRALVGSVASMASAVLVAYIFRSTDITPMLPRPILAIGSLFCFATATLGRLGWGRQSSGDDGSVEGLDQRLFHVLYWIGMCWGALAILP